MAARSAEAIGAALFIGVIVWILASGFIRGLRSRNARQDGFWPLEARPVLTEREQALYHRLVAAYPDYIVLAQVALSQLLRVKYGTPNWRSIFSRYSQLVADFVICRKDFSVVAVIELDDASHARADRQDADRRKTKAVGAGGLRLVRIPPGPIPSQGELQSLLQLGSSGQDPFAIRAEPLLPAGGREPSRIVMPALAVAVVVAAGVGVWWLVSQPGGSTLPPPIPAPSAHKPAAAVRKPKLVSAPAVDTAAIQAAEQKRQEAEQALAAQQAADELAKRKQAAWAAYYQPPASCEHPPAWLDQVECGNKYIRAKREFEKLWAVQNGLPVPQ